MSTINSAGLTLIKKWEGCRLTAYKDSVGVWTIGYGHTGKVDGKAVCKGMTITQTKADKLLSSDAAVFWAYVNNSAFVPLYSKMTENQKSALTSFAFNCGANNLKTLCANRSIAEIGEAILLYNKAGGKVNSGLVSRRKAERVLYLTGAATDVVEEETHDMDTLSKGDKGQQVRALQILLNRELGCGLVIDGSFGAKTETATKGYQKDKGLSADGICGPKTWSKLLEG